jgi:hypothetical protein
MARTAAPPEHELEPEPHESVVRQEKPFDPTAFVRGAIKNTPWIVIAIVFHVILFAILSVWYIATHKKAEEAPPATVAMKQDTKTEEAEPELQPTEVIDRNSIPKFTEDQKNGPVNPDEVIIPDADPGRRGEITDNTSRRRP